MRYIQELNGSSSVVGIIFVLMFCLIHYYIVLHHLEGRPKARIIALLLARREKRCTGVKKDSL